MSCLQNFNVSQQVLSKIVDRNVAVDMTDMYTFFGGGGGFNIKLESENSI